MTSSSPNPAGRLAQVLKERPRFHRGELETSRRVAVEESLLPKADAERIAEGAPTCYGVHDEVAQFLFETVQRDWSTLEVGLGISTIAIALTGAAHVCITPHELEHRLIREWAASVGVDLADVMFVAESSDVYLPRCGHRDLDLVFIDGKHAFPFPIIDWYYTADRLKHGGIMGIDDAQMKSVRILREFMDADPRWEAIRNFHGKTSFYRKRADSVHDVAWHMQPYVLEGMSGTNIPGPSLVRRLRARLSAMIQRLA